MSITLDLNEYVSLLIGSKEYAVISQECYLRILASDGHERLCRMERADGMMDWQGRALPALGEGLWRLWSRSSADLMAKQREGARLRREAEESYIKSLRESVSKIMLNLGVSLAIVETVVLTMNKESLEKATKKS